ncbi:PAS domain-containing SpoIIE family protein phosphatase/ATP-binding protein [Kitasatospora sp. NBC_01287]|uniref:SpoIIE family protein phosphatase n=1 Tax=Kitasatospora sp. NBC_01287 TaxID=2903573 RepID=UPI00224E1394|nr:SpoIIE family protein phosphatase [Kitasatospora sp. NBC_01287]MCX4744671.1 PAS domain-containing SpoIIE family protein phosphatase/ATP-binding protein [Kitasatospora sp. NBC_01287]
MHAPESGPPPEGGAQSAGAGGGAGLPGIVPARLDGHRLVPLATALLDADGVVLHWSEDAERLLGWRAEEIVGQLAAPLLTGAGERTEVLELYEHILTGRRWSGVFPVRHKDGHQVELDFRTYGIAGPGGRPLVLATGSDVRALRQVEANLAVVDGFFTQSPIGLAVYDTDLRYVRLNEALARMDGLPAEEHLGRRLDAVLPGINSTEIETVMRAVLATGEPVVDARSYGHTPGEPDQDRAWSASYFRLADPSGRVLGVSSSIIDVTERFQAEARAARAQERLTLLAEATSRIGTTLDMQRTAEELIAAVVPKFADFATVDLLDPVLQGEEPSLLAPDQGVLLRAVAAGEVPGSGLTGVADAVGETTAYDSHRNYTKSLRSGKSMVIAKMDEPTLRKLAAREERVAPGLAAGIHSYLLVPLLARGMVLGGAEFVRTRNPESFSEADVALAEELVARTAVCIDNARLYRRERDTALTLQRSLLPQEIHRTLGLEIAYRYLPSSVVSEVGGDWFDVVPLSCGRVALVVGDVMGHGIRAAATMGQLRTVARTLATLDMPPAQVLARLDETATGIGEGQFATCVCAVYDPVDRSCAVACAGHLPPVVMDADGVARSLQVPPGVPLGVGGVAFESIEFTLPEGSVLALYTDGLVERRGEDIDHGINELCATLAARERTLEAHCDAVVSALVRDGSEDDVAMIMARALPLPGDRIATLPLTGEGPMPARARRFTRSTLAAWGLAPLADFAELLVSELVTNALVHAQQPRRLRLFRDRMLTLEVADAGRQAPRLRPAGSEDEGGRGMYLINELAHRWGSRPTHDGKVVWAELELPLGS